MNVLIVDHIDFYLHVIIVKTILKRLIIGR